MQHVNEVRQQYSSLLAEFSAAFPDINPPESRWWQLWLSRYPFTDIRTAIQTLSQHSMKAKFTQDSTGRAITALLRDSAIQRAVPPPSAAGEKS